MGNHIFRFKTMLAATAVMAGVFCANAVDLPAGFAALDWIQSTGSQWIDTGFCPSVETKIEARINTCRRTVGWGVFFGVTRSDSSADGVLLRYSNETTNLQAWFCNDVTTSAQTCGNNVEVEVTLEKNQLVINGAASSISTTGTPYAGNLYLFCGNNGGVSWRRQAMRLYSFKITEAGEVVRDFVPCRTANAEVGLWDAVEGRFYGNCGAGRFAASDDPDLRVNAIKTVNQWIDTGVRAKSSISSLVDFSFLSSGGSTCFIGVRKTYGPSNEYGFWANGSGQCCIAYGSVNSGWLTAKYPVGTRCVVSNDCAKLFIDGTCKYSGANNTFDTGYNVVIGAYSEKGVITATGNRTFSGVFYRVEIRQDGELVRDFIPYRMGDGRAGFYDLRNSKFYGNLGDGAMTYEFCYLEDGTTLVAHEGALKAADLAGYTALRKDGWYALDASAVTALSVPLTLTAGTYALADGQAKTHTVGATLTLAGGAALEADLTTDGCDTLQAESVDVMATEENPFVIRLKTTGAPQFDAANAPVVIAGVNAADLAKFRLETNGGAAALAVRDGNLVIVTQSPTLPAGYTPLAWIASDGRQYIRTGVDMSPDTQVEMNFRVNRYVHCAAFFGTDAWTGYRYLFNMQSNKFMYHGNGVSLPAVAVGADAKVRVAKNTVALTSGGTTTAVAIDNSIQGTDKELAVFATNLGTYGAPFRLYSMTIRDGGGRLLRDFVPCRTEKGENGLWDLVEGRFHANEGTGRFLDPDDTLVNLTDLRSSGSEYLVTDYKAKDTTVVTMDMSFVAADSKCGLFGQWYEKTGNTFSFGAYMNGNKNFASVLTCGKGDDWLSNQTQPYANRRYLVTLDAPNKLCTILQDGERFDTMQHAKTITGAQTANPIRVFWVHIPDNGNPDTQKAKMRLYSMQIVESGELVRDYWPCRTADGLLGVEDRVHDHAFLGNADVTANTGFVWDGIAYLKTSETALDIHEGTLAAEQLAGITSIKKVGYHTLDASEVTSLPPLEVTRGVFSLADGAQSALTVNGTLTLRGGTRLAIDLLRTGIDTITPTQLAFDGATAETPVIIDLAAETGVDMTQTYALVPSGVSGENGVVDFIKVVGDDPMVCEIKDGALVLRVADVTTPLRAVWTGGADSAVDEAANWTCYNGQGDVVPGGLPTEKTTVVLNDGCVFNCTNGAAFICKEIVFPAWLGGDCDWRGLNLPINGTIDLRGHKLYLASSAGSGLIHDSTGFEDVAWVGSTGAQYVNLGYRHKSHTRVECVLNAQQVASGWRAVFGARNTNSKNSAFIFFLRNGNGLVTYARTGSEMAGNSAFPYDQDVRLVCEGQVARWSNPETDVELGSVTTLGTADDGVNDFFVFNLNTAGVDGATPDTSAATMKLISFKITEDGTLMRDLRPVYSRATDEFGLYDMVTHRFYASATQTKLTGPEVASAEPVARGEVHIAVPADETDASETLSVDGSAKLVKDGAGELVWNGGLIGPGVTTAVTNGCFTVGPNARMFSAGGEFVVEAPGRLDFNFQAADGGSSSVYLSELFLSGAGGDGLGALVNTGNENYGSHLANVKLTDDATISGPGRVDFRGTTAFDACGHTLTIKDTSCFAICDSTSSFAANRIVVSSNALFQPYSAAKNVIEISNGVELVNGGVLAFWDSAATPWTFPVTVGTGGGTLRAEQANGTRTYTLGATLTVTAGATLTLNGKAGCTSAGTLTRVVNEGTITGVSGQTTTFAGTLSGNGAITGTGLKFGGADSCWHVALGEEGFTERINLDQAPDDFLAGLARLDVTCVTGGVDCDLCTAGSLTVDQVKLIAITAHDANGEEVKGCRLALAEGRLHLYLGDASIPRFATWTNGKGDFNLADPGNWNCVNDYGQTIEAVPTFDTTVTLPDDLVFNCTNGAPFVCKEILLPATLAGDCDWRGLAWPINTTIDLNGHKLYLSDLKGSGLVTNSTPAGQTYERLAYIQSNSRGECIDTGVVGSSKVHWSIDVNVVSGGGSAMIFGERPSYPSTLGCGFWMGDGTSRGYPAIGFGTVDSGYNASTQSIIGNHCVISNDHARLFKDGICIIDLNDATTFDSEVTMSLFALHTKSGYERTGNRVNTTRVYALKIWEKDEEGDRLVRDFVPARCTSNGEIGLIDRANGDKWYTSPYAGLTAGPIVPLDEQACGELRLDVPAGATVENTTLRIGGLVKFVKEGAGTFVPTLGQTYGGGTQIAAGTLRCNGSPRTFCGSTYGKIVIDAGATLDLNGFGNVSEWTYVLNGGTIRSANNRGQTGYDHLQRVELTDDSFISGWGFGFVGLSWGVSELKMNGHKLVFDVTSGKDFYMGNLKVTGGGEIDLRSGGWCCLGGNAGESGKFIHAASTLLKTSGCALRMGGGELLFGGYTATGSQSWGEKTTREPILATGRVTPVSQWYDCKLLDGATLDLSRNAANWKGVCSFSSNGITGAITYAPGATIRIDLGARRVRSGECVIAWTAETRPDATFVPVRGADYAVYATDEGLFIRRGFVFFIR